MTGPGQHAEHIQMNFYRQVWLTSTVEQNSGTSAFSSVTPALTQSPLSLTHPREGKVQLGAVKSDHHAHRLQPPVPPSKRQKISPPLSLLPSLTLKYYQHYIKK